MTANAQTLQSLSLLAARCKELTLPGPLGLRGVDFGEWVLDATGLREGLAGACAVLNLDEAALGDLVSGRHSAQELFAAAKLTCQGTSEEVLVGFAPLLCWEQARAMAGFELELS